MDLKNCKRKFLENHEMEKTTFGSSHFDSRRTIKKIESALCLMHTICESASFLEINYQITNLLQLCSKFYGGVNLCFSTYRGLINDTKTSAIAKTTSATNTSDFNEGKEKKNDEDTHSHPDTIIRVESSQTFSIIIFLLLIIIIILKISEFILICFFSPNLKSLQSWSKFAMYHGSSLTLFS